MPIGAATLDQLLKEPSPEAWRIVIAQVMTIASQQLSVDDAPSEVTRRDREIATLDHLVSASGWDLWQDFGSAVKRTSERLAHWWVEPYSAKAVLILDGLSLRELPWLTKGAAEHGFALHSVSANASELPGETNTFARALGFGSRSQLQNNGGGTSHKLTPARTECVDLPWKDCADLIDSSAN
jgi:hypothetical protein